MNAPGKAAVASFVLRQKLVNFPSHPKNMKLQFTAAELEALKLVCHEHQSWPGCARLPLLDLRAIEDTKGFHQSDADRDLLANAVEATLQKNWPDVSRDLISAAQKIEAGPLPKAGVSHPPTGRVLRPWLLAEALAR